MPAQTVRLLIACPDRRGIVAAVAGFFAKHDGNILDVRQHTDREHGEFFMRVEIDPDGFTLDQHTMPEQWKPLADAFAMRWRVHWPGEVKRMAILVSGQGHCLNDLLWRWKTGELPVELPFVVSNHPDLRESVEPIGPAFHYLPVTPETKERQETEIQKLLSDHKIDFVVLARYMQILSPSFVQAYPYGIINIHHSFLPAFAGGRPYHQALKRGVKIIGATSHYVTETLDDGPIIAQRTLAVDHRDSLEDMIRKGRDLERVVLAIAVRQHIEDKILVSNKRTIVFN